MKNSYQTKQKTAILDCLERLGDRHITASEIVESLKNSGEKISLATVYRCLDKLVSKGDVKKYTTDKGACYQYAGCHCHNHFHLKCTGCGTLFHIDCDFLPMLASHIVEHHKFKVDNHRTVMYGLCEKCTG